MGSIIDFTPIIDSTFGTAEGLSFLRREGLPTIGANSGRSCVQFFHRCVVGTGLGSLLRTLYKSLIFKT